MNVYTCSGFIGFNPVGTAACVIAQTAEQAAELLSYTLVWRGLKGGIKASDMTLVDTSTESVLVLNDGDY